MKSHITKLDATETLSHYDSEYYSQAEVVLAVALKKMRRKAKNLDFNCYILDYAELPVFFVSLEIIKLRDQKGKARFQIIYREEGHWSVVDVNVKAGKFEFFLLDAAGTQYKLSEALSWIRPIFPESVVYFSLGYIQKDWHNCATFALDHAYRLAKILDLYTILDGLKNHKSADDNNLVVIPIEKFPAKFGPLLRNMQSTDLLQEKINLVDDVCMGNDSQLLKDYLAGHLQKDNKSKFINNKINNKREKIRKKTHQFVQKLSEEQYEEIFTNRKHLTIENISEIKSTDTKNKLIIFDGEVKTGEDNLNSAEILLKTNSQIFKIPKLRKKLRSKFFKPPVVAQKECLFPYLMHLVQSVKPRN